MIQETSFGIVPLKNINGDWHVLLIKHSKGEYWAFPKGHREEGETPFQAAARELLEETGLSVAQVLFEEIFSETYQFRRESTLIEKTVVYFAAEVKGEMALQSSEVSESRWIKWKEAEQVITFPQSKSICHQVMSLLKNSKGNR